MPETLTFICDHARHLVCIPYSIEALHETARILGIHKCWFHKNHYDIPKRRVREIQEKCMIVTTEDIVRIVRSIEPRDPRLKIL